MPTPGTYSGWTIYEGSEWSASVTWPGISSASGYSARMDVRELQHPQGTRLISLTVANSRVSLSSAGGNLVITLNIPSTDTLNLSQKTGPFHYDLEIVPPSGEAHAWRALMGTIAYSREVTA